MNEHTFSFLFDVNEYKKQTETPQSFWIRVGCLRDVYYRLISDTVAEACDWNRNGPLLKSFIDHLWHYQNCGELTKEEPIRHYHTGAHVVTMLLLAEEFAPELLTIEERLAIVFHDIVYNPIAPQEKNEFDSSLFFLNKFTSMVGDIKFDSAKVVSLIMGTADFPGTPTKEGRDNKLVAFDWLSYAAPAPIYFSCVAPLIKREYEDLCSEELYIEKRAEFLVRALDVSPYAWLPNNKKLHSQYLENIEKELEVLSEDLT